jgi:uncharacterized short protein YbdD (DUF466 family)
MTAKEIIEKLKATFSELTAPVKLMDASLADGTAIQVTELAVGGIVTVNGAPAPAGEYTLTDGTTLVVGDNGAITEIKPAAPAEEAPAEAPVTEDMGAKFSAFEVATSQKFADYEAKFAQYEQRLDKATKVIEGLLNLTQTLAETPTGTPDEAVKTSSNFSAEPKQKDYSILFS